MKYVIHKTYTAGNNRGKVVKVSSFTHADAIVGADSSQAKDEWATREEAEDVLAYLIGEELDSGEGDRTDLLTDEERVAMDSELANKQEGEEWFEIRDRYTDEAIKREAKRGYYDCGDYTLTIEEDEDYE